MNIEPQPEGPQPGEVWIITDEKYDPGPYDAIQFPVNRPFIVVSLSRNMIHVVAENGRGDTFVRELPRKPKWEWLRQASRLWPPVPSWEALEELKAFREDDLRAQFLRPLAGP